jgi:cytidylate kinase
MPQAPPLRIAIDGPVGAGKTSVGRRVAGRLGYRFLDTGLMYRAVTRAALDRGMALSDEEELAALSSGPAIEVEFGRDGEAEIKIDGVDATSRLRTPEVDRGVSIVSAIAAVREALVRRQREVAASAPIVMVGRDIGTVVLTDAELKVYLAADVEERATRRHREFRELGDDIRYEEVLSSLRRRDEMDTDRAASPLRPAADALMVNTDGLTADQVADGVIKLAERA